MITDMLEFRDRHINAYIRKLHPILMDYVTKILFYALKKYNPIVREYDLDSDTKLKHVHRFDIGNTIVRVEIMILLDD